MHIQRLKQSIDFILHQVFSGLAMLALRDDAYKGPRPITRSEDMADFLQPKLLGILAFFDSQLLNSRIPIQNKKLVRIQ